MVSTNGLFNFIRDRTDNQGVALLGAFVVWERVMVTIKYLMQFLIPDKSADLAKKLKIEEHARNEKSREERERARTKRQSSLSSCTNKKKTSSPFLQVQVSPNLEKLSSLSDNNFPLQELPKRSDHKVNAKKSTGKKATNRKKALKKIQPNTPKLSSNKAAKTYRMKSNSPFKEYIVHDDSRSPLLEKDGMNDQDSSPTMSEMLSLYGESDSDTEYRSPLKPSMQRSMMTRHRESELHAADERIRNRIK